MAISGVLDFPASTGGLLRVALHAAPPREGWRQVPVQLHSLSTSGMLIESGHPLKFGEKIETEFGDAAVALGEITWTGAKLFGCQFDEPVAADLLERAVSRKIDVELDSQSLSDPVETFGARLLRLRKAKRISQIDIAEKLGVTAVAISNWESDRSQPRRHRMAELAKILGVPSQQLMSHSIPLLETLPEVLAASRYQIAAIMGVEPDCVKININL